MSLIVPDFVVIATYAMLLFSIVALWLPVQHLSTAALLLAIFLGYFSGVLTGIAAAPIAMLWIACLVYRTRTNTTGTPIARAVLALVILSTALLLGVHAFPGFHNVALVERAVLSRNGAPYTLWLNFDKTVAGILLLGWYYGNLIRNAGEWRAAWRRAWPVIAVNIFTVVTLAWIFGYVNVDPKWTSLFIPWAIVNLLFVCVSEEAFFRGFIQHQLSNRLDGYRFGTAIAITVGAILFGLAHFGGGISYVLLSTVAGIGYGVAFQRSGRVEMSIVAHFLLNATHFLLFTYPRNA